MNTYEVTFDIEDESKFNKFHANYTIEAKTPIRAIKFISTPNLDYYDTLKITCTIAKNLPEGKG
jgi:hypothetical protein